MLMTLWISRSDCPSRHDNDESIHPDSSPASGVSRVPAGIGGDLKIFLILLNPPFGYKHQISTVCSDSNKLLIFVGF